MTRKPSNKKEKERKLIATDPMAFEQKYMFYCKHCDQEQIIPDWEGLAVYIGISVEELDEIARDPDMKNVANRARTNIMAILKQMAYKGKINMQMVKMNATKNHGYVDKVKSESTINASVSMKEVSMLTDEELEAEMSRLDGIASTDSKKSKKKKRKRLKKHG